MSAILGLSAMHYINMKNNAALNMLKINNTRMNILQSSGDTTDGIGCSLDTLARIDTLMELELLTSKIQYQYAKAISDQIKKQQKEDAKKFSVFA